MNTIKQQPAQLYGSIIKIENVTSKIGNSYKRITLAISNGKDPVTKEYKKSTFISVTYFGNTIFNVKDRATFAGNLEAVERTVGEKTYFNLSLMAYEAAVEAEFLPSDLGDIPF